MMSSNKNEGRGGRKRRHQDIVSYFPVKYKPISRRQWIEEDLKEYRQGYVGKKDDSKANLNVLFYTNQIESRPSGDKIDEIHKLWFGDYNLLERHHGFIQWLFPIREKGMNFHCQELMKHETKTILKDKKARRRLIVSFKLMLDFYGMKLVDEETGEVEKAPNWEERFAHLNRSTHNHLRITRILKFLGEFELEKYQVPWLEFLLRAAFVDASLPNIRDSLGTYWIGCVKENQERQRLMGLYNEYEKKQKPVYHEVSDSSSEYDTP
ncbi:opioid growth factor receptor-like protein 1 [Lineus longissimus]|uniref:opioid growth factor receptor-like protein 1 n=1 Tax=Lineus longissimus TaxID=88925 RepID=UPI002B4F2E67